MAHSPVNSEIEADSPEVRPASSPVDLEIEADSPGARPVNSPESQTGHSPEGRKGNSRKAHPASSQESQTANSPVGSEVEVDFQEAPEDLGGCSDGAGV